MRTWQQRLAHRFGLDPLREHVLQRRVPKTPWYFGDGASLMLLLTMLVGTGGILALGYVPATDAALASVQRLTHEHVLGWFVRAIHYWSAGAMMVLLFVHLFRQVLFGGYKAPREGTWLIGIVMFFLVHVMAFTGYTLRWDERALHAVGVVLHMLEDVPWCGEFLARLVSGGEHVGAPTLPRLYAVHTILVPLLLLLLAGYHMYLVILHGTFTPLERHVPVRSTRQQERLYEQQAQSRELGERFHPKASSDSAAMAIAVGFVVVLVAWFAGPAELLHPADAAAALPAEEWWFWWYSGLVAMLPEAVAPTFFVLFPPAMFVLLAALPFVDRGPFRGLRRRPIAVVSVTVCAAALLWLSERRLASPWTAWPSPEPPPVPAGVALPPDAEAGRTLFATWGCNSCHAVAGHGPGVGPDLTELPELRSRQYLHDYVLQPPAGIAMPAYAGRMPAAELDRLLDFVMAAQLFPRDR